MVKKHFFARKLLLSFIKKKYIPTIENLSFHLARVKIIGSVEYGKTINVFS